MDILAVLAAVLGVPVLLAGLWFWIARQHRRGSGRAAVGGMLGIADEIFRPETHQAHQIQKIQYELPAPAPAPKPRRTEPPA
ncbi:hypothetical protein [Paenarthrobacter nitroguajacolicus]|uniref:hypothetical protein n=1 Tax=Paenarthrobacter nitroguajacolicus TaxID=211146 RepID=UPI00285DC074|nr:hypothetical protein [Paenarthrobacter nitroguajacolicus]MDR6638333.1 hypothetical protein [Paenarthrobacter nitroguajacolicus]